MRRVRQVEPGGNLGEVAMLSRGLGRGKGSGGADQVVRRVQRVLAIAVPDHCVVR